MEEEVISLRARNEELERELKIMKAKAAANDIHLCKKWGISVTEAKMLAILADGNIHEIRELADRTSRTGSGSINAARVEIFRMRKKIAPVEIRVVWGRGYILDEPHLGVVQSVLGGD